MLCSTNYIEAVLKEDTIYWVRVRDRESDGLRRIRVRDGKKKYMFRQTIYVSWASPKKYSSQYRVNIDIEEQIKAPSQCNVPSSVLGMLK